jgi:thioredoxin reductase (NADPH)
MNDNKCEIYDICIVGGGPAGHSAALYTSRGLLKTVLFEGIDTPGGQLTQTTIVENYLGFPDGIQGYELCQKFKEQSEKWGTKIISDYVYRIKYNKHNNHFIVYFDELNQYLFSKSIIICSGSSARRLTFEGSSEFWNKGITSCAVCHGSLPIYRDQPLFVVGGGDTAMEDALYLSNFTNDVYIIHRKDAFRASKIMQQRVFNNKKIKILWNSEIEKASGNKETNAQEFLEKIIVKNKTGERTEYKAGGLFYAIGHVPSTYFLKDSDFGDVGDISDNKKYISLDEEGYIITEDDSTKTNIKGVFCAGDVRQKDKKFKQAIVAAGTGCKAALEAIDYITSL